MASKIDKIKVERFKAFREETLFNIGKHNLLVYGENGAGKSSLFDAIKVVFFYQKMREEHSEGVTPEDRQARFKSFLSSKYDHRGETGFSISIDNEDYETFIEHDDFSDFHVSMISNGDIQVGSYISYKELLNKVYIHGEVSALLDDEKRTAAISDATNKDLKDYFKENGVTVSISREDDLKCSLKGSWSEDTYIENIRDYFNEAIINLVVLVLLLNTIKLMEDGDKKIIRILVLDDIITSLDASNRLLLMRYVRNNFTKYQKFVFTHNISFFNLWLYTMNNIKKEQGEWQTINIYDCGGKHKVYNYKVPGGHEKKKSVLLRERLESGEESLQDLGNDIRRYFEELVHEFAKIVHVGGKNECSNILERLESGKIVYLYEDEGHHFKTAEDMLDHIKNIIGIDRNDIMINQLRTKCADYTANEFFKKTVLPVIRELKMYQKLSMHPLSHAHMHGMPTYTEKELSMTIVLIEKFEGIVNELIGFDVSTV